jgi:hypothetical protein
MVVLQTMPERFLAKMRLFEIATYEQKKKKQKENFTTEVVT